MGKFYAMAAVARVAATPPRAGSGGVTVALPPGWHSTTPDQGNITQPITRFAVSSGRIGPNLQGGCQVSQYTFPKTAVAIVVVEWTKPIGGYRIGVGPRRPRHFQVRLHPPPAIECFDGPGGSVEWSERGHDFAAYVLLGRRAPSALVARADAVLDTLRVTPR